MEINELIKQLQERTTSEDIILHIRQTPSGTKTDFVYVEKTDFSGAIPSTTKEYIAQLPLPCGHSLSKEITFGGYCSICSQEYCMLCAIQCRRCSRFISICCRRYFRKYIYCKKCYKLLWAKHIFYLIMKPFTEEREDIQDVAQETYPTNPATNTNKTNFSER